jgi:hypothetical protein
MTKERLRIVTSHIRSSYSLGLVLTLALLLAMFGTGSILAQGAGYLEGQVVNQTENGDIPADISVTLVTFKGMSMEATTEVQTDREGRFRFDDLDTSEDNIYQVAAEYGGVNYLTDFIVFEEGKIPPVTLSVYEPTTDGTGIHIERLHLIINVHPRRLQVAQLYVFSNPGSRTYVGDAEEDAEVLRLSLPEAASDLEFQDGQMGDRYLSTPEGIVDTAPVLPGTGNHQVLLSYNLDYDSSQFAFSVTDVFSVTGVNVLISDPAVEVSSPILQAEGSRNMQGQDWVSLRGEQLPPGQEIRLSFDNLPLEERETPAPPGALASRSADTLKFVVLGLVLFGLGVLAGYNLPRKQGAEESPSGKAPSVESTSEVLEEDDLIIALADLDDTFGRGELPKAEYQKRRAKLKRQLAGQMRQKEK